MNAHSLIIRDALIFDGVNPGRGEPTDVRVENNVIVEIGPDLHAPTYVPAIDMWPPTPSRRRPSFAASRRVSEPSNTQI